MKATTFAIFAAVIAVAFISTSAFSAVVFDEPFAYPDGALDGTGGWVAYSGIGNKPMQVISGTARVEQSSGSGEDLQTPFPQQPADGVTYVCFDLMVPRQGPLGDAAIGAAIWFASLRQDPDFFFFPRAWITGATSGGDYTVGLSSTSGSLQATWGSDLSYGVTYKIAMAYDGNTGEARLWVDPASEADASITDTGFSGDQPNHFVLRQSSGGLGENSYQIIDNVKVATSLAEACDLPVQNLERTWGGVKGIYR